MTSPGPNPRNSPPPALLISLGAVFFSLSAVFSTTLDGTAGTIATIGFLLAGGIMFGVGLVRLLKSRGGGGG